MVRVAVEEWQDKQDSNLSRTNLELWLISWEKSRKDGTLQKLFYHTNVSMDLEVFEKNESSRSGLTQNLSIVYKMANHKKIITPT